VASPIELAPEEPSPEAGEPPVEEIATEIAVQPEEEVVETAPESRQDEAAAAVEVARAVAVADGEEPAEPASEPEEAEDSQPATASPVAEEAAPTTLARYTEAVRQVRGHLKKKDFAGAVTVADGVLQLEDLIGEQRAWLLYLKARAERGRGKHLAAARLYGEAIDHHPPGAHYKNSLAWLMCTSKHPRVRDLEAAVTMAEEAVQDGGARPQYLDTLARTYFEAGRFEDAVLTQRRAVDADPKRSAFQNRLDWYRDEAIKIASR
jgi:tetratricopeptide (TPR) repeat protein